MCASFLLSFPIRYLTLPSSLPWHFHIYVGHLTTNPHLCLCLHFPPVFFCVASFIIPSWG
jgi:hypothetical protein